MDPGVLAAIRLLPKHRKAIKTLVLSSESFRSLCVDLVDAEQALQRWDNSDDPGMAARRIEYRHLIDDLEAEIRQAISEWLAGPEGGGKE